MFALPGKSFALLSVVRMTSKENDEDRCSGELEARAEEGQKECFHVGHLTSQTEVHPNAASLLGLCRGPVEHSQNVRFSAPCLLTRTGLLCTTVLLMECRYERPECGLEFEAELVPPMG